MGPTKLKGNNQSRVYIRCGVRRLFPFMLAMLLAGCSTLPDVAGKSSSHALENTDQTAIGRAVEKRRPADRELSGFRLLGSGLDAFVARVALAIRAEKSIDAQYYLLHDDLAGTLFLGLLLEAADRGVRVRLLLDDMGLAGQDRRLATLAHHPGIEIRIVNPFSRRTPRLTQLVTRLGSVTRRMHIKTFTVDNQATIIGGRNIGNEYFEADPELAFGDLDVFAVGPVAREVSRAFDQYWNHELAYPIEYLAEDAIRQQDLEELRVDLLRYRNRQLDSDYLRALQDSELAMSLVNGNVSIDWAPVELVVDHADKLVSPRKRTDLHLLDQLRPYGDMIKEELIIFSPYFVPGKDFVDWLETKVEEGVRVRVLTNSLASTDVGAVHAGYAKYRRALLRAGVELHELNSMTENEPWKAWLNTEYESRPSLHAKSFVIDREILFIGSMNIDPRSIVENAEIGMVINSPELAGNIAGWLDNELDRIAFKIGLHIHDNGATNITYRVPAEENGETWFTEPYAGPLQRLGINLLKLLPVESQL